MILIRNNLTLFLHLICYKIYLPTAQLLYMKTQLLLFLTLLTYQLTAQISGKITDATGDPLPFASIYIQGTSTGTTSNIEGNYELELKEGTYQLVFQYVGYQQLRKEVKVSTKPINLDVSLSSEKIDLQQVIVSANAEDPAYRVIREAIKKRQYFRDLIKSFAVKSYIKGSIKMEDAPETILGQEVGDISGSLDSNRQGIIYLSESQSNYYYQQPKNYKEVMISSKVSGDDNGFSWNAASDVELSFYDNYTPLGRQIISPIAETALNYYKYRLLGTFYDDEGRLINKIEIIPKRSEDPVYTGNIYIVEDLWNIQSVDVFVNGQGMKQPGVDSLHIRQVYVPIEAPDKWAKLSQSYTFKAGAFGFKMGGTFAVVFNEYDLNPAFPNGFFTNETFKVESGANERSQVFWDSIRPIPLTEEENLDYHRKDSIKVVIRTEAYLDSVDRVRNKFKVSNLLLGYTYRKSFEKQFFSIGSPLSTIQFNPVQGFYGALNMTYRREYDEDNLKWWEIEPTVTYSFAEKRWRGEGHFKYNFNRTNYAQFTMSGGAKTQQFNSNEPIAPTIASAYALIGGQNLIDIYDKIYGKVGFRQEVANGVLLYASSEYARRKPLILNTSYSWKELEEGYESNDPQDPNFYGVSFQESAIFKVNLSMRLRWQQKYISYPNKKFITGSKLPDLWIHYERATKIEDKGVEYDKISIEIHENYLPIGLIGFTKFRLGAGKILSSEDTEFIDFFHFNGNETFIGNPDKYLTSFKTMPYYKYSTDDFYFKAHVEHSFESFLLDKIPGISKLGWTTVVGANYLNTFDEKEYLELSLGLDRIGFGLFRFLRVDGIVSFSESGYEGIGFLLGVNLPN